MPWRYQPVFTEQDGERTYSLCEVYFDEAGAFKGWSENEMVAPGGAELEELTGELTRMLVDAMSYVPVRFSDLKPGMRLPPRVTIDERNSLADFIDNTKGMFKRAPKPIVQ